MPAEDSVRRPFRGLVRRKGSISRLTAGRHPRWATSLHQASCPGAGGGGVSADLRPMRYCRSRPGLDSPAVSVRVRRVQVRVAGNFPGSLRLNFLKDLRASRPKLPVPHCVRAGRPHFGHATNRRNAVDGGVVVS